MCSLFLGATGHVPFLKKCKEAGLLNELFEGILEKLDSIQGKLLNDTASESGTELAKCKWILENQTSSLHAFSLPSLNYSLKTLVLDRELIQWSEHLLFLQGTKGQFLASTWWLTILTPVWGESNILFYPVQSLGKHMLPACIHRQNTQTQNNKPKNSS